MRRLTSALRRADAQQPRLRATPRRKGFTLIEMMVVLVIIAILAGLLLAAFGPARQTAREAQVVAEMQSLKASITAFKTDFKMDPPSSIVISESVAGWAAHPVDRALLKRLWPSFNFTIPRDFNGDGDSTDIVALDGAECLVFFLGGVVDPVSGQLRGFSKNPGNPFAMDNGSRQGPFYEFEGGIDPSTRMPLGRLVDTDSDGAPEYIDSLPSQTQPIVYFSSYDGTGYRTDNTEDANANGSLDAGEDKNGNGRLDHRMQFAYFKDAARKSPYNASGFQLISPGQDASYGVGGHLDSAQFSGNRAAEVDNLALFHSGRLGNK
jgi:prepilin-type N-terminal cleavage/methylation domain-containing protein